MQTHCDVDNSFKTFTLRAKNSIFLIGQKKHSQANSHETLCYQFKVKWKKNKKIKTTKTYRTSNIKYSTIHMPRVSKTQTTSNQYKLVTKNKNPGQESNTVCLIQSLLC